MGKWSDQEAYGGVNAYQDRPAQLGGACRGIVRLPCLGRQDQDGLRARQGIVGRAGRQMRSRQQGSEVRQKVGQEVVAPRQAVQRQRMLPASNTRICSCGTGSARISVVVRPVVRPRSTRLTPPWATI